MAIIPRKPLLRLDPPANISRKKGGGTPQSRRFTPNEQRSNPAGQRLAALAAQLDGGISPLQFRADPEAIAPERLLAFELTGSIMQFTAAVGLVQGLEFLGAEDLDEDGVDSDPVIYMMVPNERAFRHIITLWREWQRTGEVPPRFSTWKALLSQLRNVRAWGPQDRLTAADQEILRLELSRDTALHRVEIELVFRTSGDLAEQQARDAIAAADGVIISRSRIAGAGYHALLVDIPGPTLANLISRSPTGLAGVEAIFQIRPQSVFQRIPSEEFDTTVDTPVPDLSAEPIAAIFDAVPLSEHPRLSGALSIDDPFDLEGQAVGPRLHGTAMASAVLHGDINAAWERPLQRRIHFVNMLYATSTPDEPERFPNLLPADMFERAVLGMRVGENASAPQVLIINASLGDPNKAFAGRLSGWARVVDYLAAKYGILFVISAGNHNTALETADMTASAFEDLDPAERARVALRASARQHGSRRVLAPAEAMNAITVGSLHADSFVNPRSLPANIFDVWAGAGLCSVSSALGPGHNGATKPEILVPGGRHHVRLKPKGANHLLAPLETNAASFGGIAVAGPQFGTSPGPNVVVRSVGTSVAAALATGVATRAHEALEAAYPDFGALPSAQRACLLKALLVHGARWTSARDLLVEVLGPAKADKHYKQKDNVRRYIGYGAYDPDLIINCADDRATLWSVGSLMQDHGRRFRIPWPATMNAKAQPHGLSATLAWFSPPKPGAVSYRAVKMKIIKPTQLGTAGIVASSVQPDPRQAEKGTVIHRRWEGKKAAAMAGDGYFELDVQREADGGDTPVNFALVVTLQMDGEVEIYNQVRNRVAIKPLTPVAVA